MLTYEKWEDDIPSKLSIVLKDYMDVLKWSFKEYGDQILYACSLGAEGIVLLDLLSKVHPNTRVIFLDTDLHFRETYDLISKVKHRYPNLQLDIVKPEITIEHQTIAYGEELWKHNPNQCCYLRKVLPLQSELSSVEAWISGLRREQSLTRQNVEYINKDERFKKIKICPLIHWTWEDVWNYIRLNNLPYNELHDRNYPSIGCSKCTVPVIDGKSRLGRWVHSEKTECGLHLPG